MLVSVAEPEVVTNVDQCVYLLHMMNSLTNYLGPGTLYEKLSVLELKVIL